MLPSDTYRCVAPVAVSNVESEAPSEHGVPEVSVRVICARRSPRGLVRPDEANARLAEVAALLASVKLVAVPMVEPAGVVNAMLPTHEAAVPLEEADAVLTTLTRAVSVLPSPNSGNVRVLVFDVVCALRDSAPSAQAIKIHLSL
jgi:hypothetical protein